MERSNLVWLIGRRGVGKTGTEAPESRKSGSVSLRLSGANFHRVRRGLLVGVSLSVFLGWLVVPDVVRTCRNTVVKHVGFGPVAGARAFSTLFAADEPFFWNLKAGGNGGTVVSRLDGFDLDGFSGIARARAAGASRAGSAATPLSVALSVSFLIGGFAIIDLIQSRRAVFVSPLRVAARLRRGMTRTLDRARNWGNTNAALTPIPRLARVHVSVTVVLAFGFFVGWFTAPDFVRRREASAIGSPEASSAASTRSPLQFASLLGRKRAKFAVPAPRLEEERAADPAGSLRKSLELDVRDEDLETHRETSTKVRMAALGAYPGFVDPAAQRGDATSPWGDDSSDFGSDRDGSENDRYALLTPARFGGDGGTPGGGSDGSLASAFPGEDGSGESTGESDSPLEPGSPEDSGDEPKETAGECAADDPLCLLRRQVSGLLAVPDQALVLFSPDATDEEVAAALAPSRGRIVECFSNGYCLVETPQNPDLAGTIVQLRDSPGVINAEPNYVREIAEGASDTLYPIQWSLSKIQAGGAWSAMGVTTRVRVAVLDTGFDLQHPDLKNVWTETHNALNDGQPVTGNPDHGTMVAGVLAALGDDAYGVAGANKKWADLILVKVFDNGSTTSDARIIQGIDKLPGNTRVVNLSLAGHGSPASALCSAIASKSKVLFVIAAGNQGTSEKLYPAACDSSNVLAVASTDLSDLLAPSSSRGSWVHLAAPGEGIFTDAPNSQVTMGSGTSMAAPHVAAVASMLYAKLNGSASPTDVKDAILRSVDRPPLRLDVQSGGRLNACKALGGKC